MTYLSGKEKNRKNYKLYALFGVVFLIVLIFWPFIRKNFHSFLGPVFVGYGSTKQSLTIFPEFFYTYSTSHRSLMARQKELELEVENLENMLADKDGYIRESLLGSTSTTTLSSLKKIPIVLYPLMQDITKIYSTVLLSKGVSGGVVIGDVVYLRGNQAICTIKEVYHSSSVCHLLTASGTVTEGVTSSSSIALSLVGRGGYFIADIARGTPVLAGEKVYLRSNPKMVLGTVRQVTNNNQDTSWHVFVEGAYNPVSSSVFYVQH